MLLVKKMQFFSLFVFAQNKMRSPKNCVFPEGLTHAFGQKMLLFSLFIIGQKRTRNKV